LNADPRARSSTTDDARERGIRRETRDDVRRRARIRESTEWRRAADPPY